MFMNSIVYEYKCTYGFYLEHKVSSIMCLSRKILPSPFIIVFCFLNKFIYLFLAVSGVRCCRQPFSSCGEQGLLFVVALASYCGGCSCCGAQTLGARASVVVAHGL